MIPEKIKRIVLLGSGNVATHLGRALKWSRYEIVQVYSYTFENAEALANELQATPTANIEDVVPDADLYLICINDDVVKPIAGQLSVNGIVAHTSGSIPMDVLASSSEYFGVFYPLQTFSKTKDVELEGIPLLVEGSTPEVEQMLYDLGTRLTSQVRRLSSEQRTILHIAAVFACNFTNHMFGISEMLLKEHNLDLADLKPLILETTSKALEHSPSEIQTGPAVRKDDELIRKHISMLNDHPKFSEIYKLLSGSIQIMHSLVHEK